MLKERSISKVQLESKESVKIGTFAVRGVFQVKSGQRGGAGMGVKREFFVVGAGLVSFGRAVGELVGRFGVCWWRVLGAGYWVVLLLGWLGRRRVILAQNVCLPVSQVSQFPGDAVQGFKHRN